MHQTYLDVPRTSRVLLFTQSGSARRDPVALLSVVRSSSEIPSVSGYRSGKGSRRRSPASGEMQRLAACRSGPAFVLPGASSVPAPRAHVVAQVSSRPDAVRICDGRVLHPGPEGVACGPDGGVAGGSLKECLEVTPGVYTYRLA